MDGSLVPVYDLEIGFCGAQTVPLFQDRLADRTGVVPVAVIGMNMDRVQADVFPVQDPEPGGDDGSAVVSDGRTDGLLWDCPVHGRYDGAMHDIGGAFQGKERFDPLQRDETAGGDEDVRVQVGDIVQRAGHNMGRVLDFVAAFFQIAVKFGRHQRTDLKDTWSSPLPIDFFTVIDLLRNRKQRRSDLFHTVGPVGVKVRKAEDPSVVNLHLMGRPCVQ